MDFRRQLGKVRTAEALAPFEALLAEVEAFMPQEQAATRFYPQFHYLEIYANYYFVKDEVQAEYQTNLRLLDLMQQHPWYAQDKPLNQVVV